MAETLKIATDSGAKGSEPGNAIEAWAKEIEAATNGDLTVEIFYQNELGGQQEVFDLLMAGDIDLMLNWPMTSYDQRISLIYTPYMFTEWDEALAAYAKDGWLSTALSDVYADNGLKFLGAWPEGFNGVGTKGGHATTVEAAKPFKVRVPSSRHSQKPSPPWGIRPQRSIGANSTRRSRQAWLMATAPM